MKKLLFVLLLAFVTAPLAMSQGSIFIVTDAPELEVEGAGNLGDYLRGLGYTVDVDEGEDEESAYRGPLTNAEIAKLESYDLVIVHRATSSGSFNYGDDWNSLYVPILCGSAYLPRDSRWQWVAAGNARIEATGVTIVDEDHPIVDGLTGEFYSTALSIDILAEGDVGGGNIVATAEYTDDEGNTFTGTAIAVWEAYDDFASSQTHNAPRVFMPLFRYHEDDVGGTFADYSQNGLDLIGQAVEFTMDLPSNVTSKQWELY